MPESDLDPAAPDGFTPLSPDDEAHIAALLATLRDPAPSVPPDVATRIDAALAAEQLARRGAAGAAAVEAVATAGGAATPVPGSDSPLNPGAAASGSADPGAESAAVAEGQLAPVESPAAPAAGADVAESRPSTRVRVVPSASRAPLTRAMFATAAAIAAIGLIVGHPWSRNTGSVTADGPTSSPPAQTRSGTGLVAADPHETLMQVSRHSYARSSLARDAAAFMAGQGGGVQVRASDAPRQWRAVSACVSKTVAALGTSRRYKVDLGWLDGRASAIVVTARGTGTNPGTEVTVLQSIDGRCSVAARTTLTR